MEMCSDHAPSFVRNLRKQGRDRYVFPKNFAALINKDSFLCMLNSVQVAMHKVL